MPLNYREIAQSLTNRIQRGDWAPGAQLPTYNELAAEYEVSVSTMQRVLLLLRERGVVRGEPGRGIYVDEGFGRG